MKLHTSPNSSATLPSDCLLHRVGANEPGAFEELLDQYRSLIAFLVRRIARLRPSDPEFDDAMQDVSVALWQAASRFDPNRGSEATFISTIARRRLIDRLRRAALHPNVVDLTVEPVQAVESADAFADAAQFAVASLDEDARTLFEMRALHGRSSEEIARATGLTANKVKMRLHRMRLRLRHQVEVARAAAA